MAKVDAWITHCPECRARISLAVTVKEGTKVLGQQAIEARVAVDATKMREHMRDKHQKFPAPKAAAEGRPTETPRRTWPGSQVT